MFRSCSALILLALSGTPALAQQPHTNDAPPPVPAVAPPTNAITPHTTAPDTGVTVSKPAPVPTTVPEQISPANRASEAGGHSHVNTAPEDSPKLSR